MQRTVYCQAMELTPCQSLALNDLQSKNNVFLTGEAGTGKSFLLHHYILRYSPKAPVLASTGAAAVLIGGRTFHSFFGLGILEGGRERTVDKAIKNGKLRKRLKECEEIVIDEISMLPGEVLATAEEIVRTVREIDAPWGGLRVVAVGDFAQLPPVTRSFSQRDWGFLHPVWKYSEFQTICLQSPIRYIDSEFYEVLNTIRLGDMSEKVKGLLALRQGMDLPSEVTHLYPRRNKVKEYNDKRLGELDSDLTVIKTLYDGRPTAIEQLKRNAPVPELLHLKEGAYVMLQQNDPIGRWVNGSTGWVRNIGKEKISVELVNGKFVKVAKVSFSQIDAEGDIVASAVNFPMTLAYATTIHKSQGQTFEKAVVDLKGLWEPGQAYVALSRLRSQKGLYLKGWETKSFRVDPAVSEFYQNIQGVREQPLDL